MGQPRCDRIGPLLSGGSLRQTGSGRSGRPGGPCCRSIGVAQEPPPRQGHPEALRHGVRASSATLLCGIRLSGLRLWASSVALRYAMLTSVAAVRPPPPPPSALWREEVLHNGALMHPLGPSHFDLAVYGQPFSIAVLLRIPAVTTYLMQPQRVLRLRPADAGPAIGAFHWRWPALAEGARVMVPSHGEVAVSGVPLGKGLDTEALHVFGLSFDPRGELRISVDGQEVATLRSERVDLGMHSVELDLASALGRDEVAFAGDVFDIQIWLGSALSLAQLIGHASAPQPTIHARRPTLCPAAHAEPWAGLRNRLAAIMGCVRLPGCVLPEPPHRLIAGIADEIAYADVSDYDAKSAECPLGFAATMVALLLHGQLENRADAITVTGMLKLVISLTPATPPPEPTFGYTRPLIMLRQLHQLAQRRLAATLSVPAEMPTETHGGKHSPPEAGGNATSDSAVTTRHSAVFLEGLRLCLLHVAESPVGWLRNSVESLATGGALTIGVGLVVHVDSCGGLWNTTHTHEGWYLAWLQRRFSASLSCGAKPTACWAPGAVLVLWLSTSWHLLPFRPALVRARLHTAASLLQHRGVQRIAGVSLSEKALHGAAGFDGNGRRVVMSASRRKAARPEDLWALALSTPALAGGWNASGAASILASMQAFSAEIPPNRSWLTAAAEGDGTLEKLKRCTLPDTDALCIPASLWPGGLHPTDGTDVWLTHRVAAAKVFAARNGSGVVALSRGLFHQSRGDHYDPTPAADSVGVPECFACDIVPPDDDFVLYLVPLDVVGPCRELFSNLLLDVLEALHLASFQGPTTTLVEPSISNAVWRRYGQREVEQLKQSGRAKSIYSYWNPQTACGLRHGSSTRFGELFDWQALVSWLRSVRGIRGGVSWSDFSAHTHRSLDVVAMLADHPGGDGAAIVRCADSNTSVTLRFFDDDFTVHRRVCVRSKSQEHAGGFELRFLDVPELAAAVRGAVTRARADGRQWASVGLYLYWIEGAERARLHPGRYGRLSSHSSYASMWQGIRFSPGITARAAAIGRRLGLSGHRFLATHWRRGDWFLGPHPRKLEQASLAEAPRFANVLREHLARLGLRIVFLMTNAPVGGPDAAALAAELGDATVVQAPVLTGDRNALRQLCVEMALASEADFFVAFGDGIVQGMASMPSLLVLQMRLHAMARPLSSNAFSFVRPEQDALGV